MRSYKGFTLIELLVVVSTIGILMTVLMPALNNAKESGKKSVCANNMKQIYTGAIFHVNDHDGYLPARYHWYNDIADVFGIEYSTDYIASKHAEGVFFCPNTVPWTNPDKLMISSYGPTLTAIKSATAKKPGMRGGWQSYWNGGGSVPKRLVNVSDDSILMIEKRISIEIWSKYAISYDFNRPGYTNTLDSPYNKTWGTAYRHTEKANSVFKDGHVQSYDSDQKFDETHWTMK